MHRVTFEYDPQLLVFEYILSSISFCQGRKDANFYSISQIVPGSTWKSKLWYIIEGCQRESDKNKRCNFWKPNEQTIRVSKPVILALGFQKIELIKFEILLGGIWLFITSVWAFYLNQFAEHFYSLLLLFIDFSAAIATGSGQRSESTFSKTAPR